MNVVWKEEGDLLQPLGISCYQKNTFLAYSVYSEITCLPWKPARYDILSHSEVQGSFAVKIRTISSRAFFLICSKYDFFVFLIDLMRIALTTQTVWRMSTPIYKTLSSFESSFPFEFQTFPWRKRLKHIFKEVVLFLTVRNKHLFAF